MRIPAPIPTLAYNMLTSAGHRAKAFCPPRLSDTRDSTTFGAEALKLEKMTLDLRFKMALHEL